MKKADRLRHAADTYLRIQTVGLTKSNESLSRQREEVPRLFPEEPPLFDKWGQIPISP